MALRDEDRRALDWLAGEESDSRITGPRDSIGRYLLGGDANWFQAEDGVEKLVDVLGSDGPLMTELKNGVQSADEQAVWLERVAEKVRYTEPEYDGDYGLFYRFDQERSAYEWCADPNAAGAEWMSQSAADAFAARRASQAADESGGEPAGTGAGAAAEQAAWWDEGWGMFYRLGESGVYEYSHKSATDPGTPDGVWLTGEQVQQLRARTSAENVESSAETVPDAVSGQLPSQSAMTGKPPEGSQPAPAPAPGDVEAALAYFEQLGVTALREVMADADALFAELNRLGVA